MDNKEKLELARDWYNDQSTTKKEKVLLEKLFPEIIESEDERIRKELIKLMVQMSNTIVENYTTIEILTFVAWLEKQGEKKPADKIESKFKIGDWIVSPGGCYLHILDIEEDGYLCEDILGEETKVLCEHPNCGFKLWTIEDAKDGVVLVSTNGCPFIYKKSDDAEARYYCCVDCDNNFRVGDSTSYCGFKDSSKPAAKEQRETLFKAMREAGYEWDAEKKELKKIDKKELRKIDSYCQENCKGFQETGKCYADGECKAKKEARQKLAWSDEDEETLTRIMFSFEEKMFPSKKECRKNIDFLNSLKK